MSHHRDRAFASIATVIASLIASMITSLIATLIAMTVFVSAAAAADVRGTVGVDSRWYPDAPASPDQNRDSFSASAYLDLQVSAQAAGDTRYDLDLFARLAPSGSRRLSGDVRQATVQWRRERLEAKLGVLAETWGVLEAWNPADVVNQRDLAEDFQGEAKLGQPGAALLVPGERTSVAIYAFTASRERRYGEGRDRLRVLPAPVLDERFESGRWAPGVAIRTQSRFGAFDLALSHYRGHSREPLLKPRLGATGLLGFDAVYERIDQSAVEAQYVAGDSVVKAELIHRSGGQDAFWGGGIGVETGFSKIAGGAGDLALYAEYYRDTRDDSAPPTPFQRDVFLGLRYTRNDVGDTVLEARGTYDLDHRSTLLDLRATRRIFRDAVLSMSWIKALSAEDDTALRGIDRDAYLELGFAWYF
jgi:hypothetical protein